MLYFDNPFFSEHTHTHTYIYIHGHVNSYRMWQSAANLEGRNHLCQLYHIFEQ